MQDMDIRDPEEGPHPIYQASGQCRTPFAAVKSVEFETVFLSGRRVQY